METLPFLLVALLALCMMPSVSSLECYDCAYAPGLPGATVCDGDNVTTITCPMYFDRCMTIKFEMEIVPGAIEMKKCSNSLACNPQSKYYTCTLLKDSVTSCTIDCCQGDLCNVDGPAATSTPVAGPTSTRISGPTPTSTPIAGQSSTVKPNSTILEPASQ